MLRYTLRRVLTSLPLILLVAVGLRALMALVPGDASALWINPDNPEIIVQGNDGGGTVTLDGGRSWSTQLNQPTAEFYRVSVDQGHPYRLYGAQQDNSTITVPSGQGRASGAGRQGVERSTPSTQPATRRSIALTRSPAPRRRRFLMKPTDSSITPCAA